MGRVRGNIQRVAGTDDRLIATEGCFHLPFEQDKSLLEVMPMRWRSAAWWDVHINYAEASIGLLARHGDGVGIADQPKVGDAVGLRQCEIAGEIVGWDRS